MERLLLKRLGDTQDQDILEATEHSSSPQVGRVLRDVLQRIDRREGDAKLWTYNNILAELRTEMKQDKLDSFKLMSGDESDFPSGFGNLQEAEALVRLQFYKKIKAALQQRRNVIQTKDPEEVKVNQGEQLDKAVHNMGRKLHEMSTDKRTLAEELARRATGKGKAAENIIKLFGLEPLIQREGVGYPVKKFDPTDADFNAIDNPLLNKLSDEFFDAALKDADRMIKTAQVPARGILMGHAAGKNNDDSQPGVLVSRDADGNPIPPNDFGKYQIVRQPDGPLAPRQGDQPGQIPEIIINTPKPPAGDRPALPNGQSATQSGSENTNHAPTSPSEGDEINYRIVDDPALRTRLDTFRGSDDYRRGSDYLARQFGGKEQILPKKEGETEAVYQGRFLAELDGRIRTPEKYASNDPILE
jgi:hypothetical protein